MAIPTLVLRTIKGSALTYQEMDSNFQNLANLEVAGGSNYSNTNVAAYLTSQSITSYSNVQVGAYLTTNPPAGTYSNVQVGAYLTTNPPAGTYSNVQVGAYLTTNPPAGTYSNVQVANYLPTYSGNVANIRLGTSGVLTFPDGTTQTTAASGGGSSYGNANVTAYTVSMGFTNFSNVNVAALITTNGLTNYSNVNVIAYLAGNVTVGNISATYFTGNGSQLTGLSSGSGIANVSVDTAPQLGGNLNVNNKTITGNVFNKGIEFSFPAVDTTATLKFSSTAGSPGGGAYYGGTAGVAYYCGTGETTSFQVTGNVNNNQPQLKLQNVNTGSSSEAKIILYEATGAGSELAMFKPSANTYSLGASGSTKYGDGGMYNAGGNLKLYAWDTSTNPKHITFQGLSTSTAADEPFDFDLANGDLRTLGNINLAAGKGVYVNGVAISAGGGTYGNTEVAAYLPTYTGNIANVRLGVSGRITFADGTTQTTAGGGSGIANVSVDTTPTLGGNLNPNGFSITANIAHTIADGGDANLQRSKAVFRFENTDTRENLASAIAIVGKGKNMRLGVVGNDPTANGFGISAGSSFIEGTNGLTSDLYFFNYGNINFSAGGVSMTNKGIEINGYQDNVGTSRSLYINGINVGGGAVPNYALNNTIHANVELQSNSTLRQVRILDQKFIANAFSSASGNIVLKNSSDETTGYDQHVLSLSGNINITNTGTFTERSAGKQVQAIIETNGYNITFENSYFKLRNNIKNISSMEVAKLTFTFVNNEAGAGTHALVDVDDYTANDPATPGSTLGKVGGFSLGYLEMPQVTAGNVTLALADSGKHFYSTSSAPLTVTIPVNSSVAFPIGTEVTVVNRGTANLTVDKGSASLYLAGNTTSASRTITTYGVATLLKVETDIWMISGTGVV